MKTGFDVFYEERFDEHQLEFLRKSVAIMKVLTEESIQTAKRFSSACGREIIQPDDIHFALMYEAHEFFEKDIDQRFFEELAIEQQHTYDTEESSEEEEEEEEEEMGEEDGEMFSTECVSIDPEEVAFHAKVLHYAATWNTWFPDDPIKMMIKSAVDKTAQAEN